MKFALHCVVTVMLCLSGAAHAEKILIAAASDLKFAMDDIVAAYRTAHAADKVDVIYGSSGKFHTQISQGAPYDLYFSADIAYAEALKEKGFAASEVMPYAVGRIVLWSATRDASKMNLQSLLDPAITRIAIANPKHAPYGKRAEEALRSQGLWEKLTAKLVYGESISHTAQFIQTGNAQVGIIALALALNPELAEKGGYWMIPAQWHAPLEQGFIITRRAQDNAVARRFADYMNAAEARTIMTRYGFVLPEAPESIQPREHGHAHGQ